MPCPFVSFFFSGFTSPSAAFSDDFSADFAVLSDSFLSVLSDFFVSPAVVLLTSAASYSFFAKIFTSFASKEHFDMASFNCAANFCRTFRYSCRQFPVYIALSDNGSVFGKLRHMLLRWHRSYINRAFFGRYPDIRL